MDFIRKYDIELEKEHYYAGETLRGRVLIENIENLRVTGVQLFLRGKAHVEWRITRAGERRTVKEDEYFIDEKLIVWGSAAAECVDDRSISILRRGDHRFPFEFHLPSSTSSLPCSFESRIGTVRYYLRVIIDIPYASPPQGLKYFTVIGPYIDCMDNRFTTPVSGMKQTMNKCLRCCFLSGPVTIEASLERTAYCCGEKIRLKCDVQNGSEQDVTLFCRLIQLVEFRINKGAFGLTKDISHQVLELTSPPSIAAHSTRSFHDLSDDLEVPVMPPTMVDVCKVIEISYVLRIGLHLEKSGDDLQLDFPVFVATAPHEALINAGQQKQEISYEPADEHVEGGIYVSPEFQLGQVYDGAADHVEDVILYRPVYVCVASPRLSTAAPSPSPPAPAPGAAGQLSNGHSPSSLHVSASTCAPTDRPTAVNYEVSRPKTSTDCNPNTKQMASTDPVSPATALPISSFPLDAHAVAEAGQQNRQTATTGAGKKNVLKEEQSPSSSGRKNLGPAEATQTHFKDFAAQRGAPIECHWIQPESGTRVGRERGTTGDRPPLTTTTQKTTDGESTNPSHLVEQQQQRHHHQPHHLSTTGTDAAAVSPALRSACSVSVQPSQTQVPGVREGGGRGEGGRSDRGGVTEGRERNERRGIYGREKKVLGKEKDPIETVSSAFTFSSSSSSCTTSSSSSSSAAAVLSSLPLLYSNVASLSDNEHDKQMKQRSVRVSSELGGEQRRTEPACMDSEISTAAPRAGREATRNTEGERNGK